MRETLANLKKYFHASQIETGFSSKAKFHHNSTGKFM